MVERMRLNVTLYVHCLSSSLRKERLQTVSSAFLWSAAIWLCYVVLHSRCSIAYSGSQKTNNLIKIVKKGVTHSLRMLLTTHKQYVHKPKEKFHTYCILSCGWYPGVWISCINASEHSGPSSQVGKEDGTEFRKVGKENSDVGYHPQERTQHTKHGESLTSRIFHRVASIISWQ